MAKLKLGDNGSSSKPGGSASGTGNKRTGGGSRGRGRAGGGARQAPQRNEEGMG
jgi:hypothetical protein